MRLAPWHRDRPLRPGSRRLPALVPATRRESSVDCERGCHADDEIPEPPAPLPDSAAADTGRRRVLRAAADGPADAALVLRATSTRRGALVANALSDSIDEACARTSQGAAPARRCSTARRRTSGWSPSACARSTARMLRHTARFPRDLTCAQANELARRAARSAPGARRRRGPRRRAPRSTAQTAPSRQTWCCCTT